MIRTRLILAAALLAVCSLANAATAYVTEFLGPTPGRGVYFQAVVTPALASQAITFAGTSVQSAAFNSQTYIIRVHVDAVALVEIGGSSPTATTTSMRMVAGQTEYFVVTPGQKLAVKTP